MEKSDQFEWSCALFDKEGRLLEWDSGFEAEFEVVGDLIALGARFIDILRGAYAKAFGSRFFILGENRSLDDIPRFLEERLGNFGKPASFEYITSCNKLVRVNEQLTPSGGISRVAHDVSMERKSHHALLAAKRDNRLATTEIPIWFRRDPEGHITFPPISDDLRLFLGVPPDSCGSDPLALYSLIEETAEEKAQNGALFLESIRNLAPYTVNVRVRSPNGPMKLIRGTFAPTAESDGAILWTGLLRDVTSERRTEDELDLLRSAVVHSGDGIVIFETPGDQASGTRSPGSILYVNRAFEQLCGHTADELIGKHTNAFRKYYGNSNLAVHIASALTTGDSTSFEFEMFGIDGHSFWVEGRVAVLQRDFDGTFRWALVVRDIAERRAVHAELVDARDKAEAANRAKSQFLANMSHEFRTPLNAIIGFSEVIKEELIGANGNPRYREYANDIHTSGKHLLDIINDVLEMSKIEADRLELKETEIDFAAVVESAFKFVEQQALEAGVKLSHDVARDLPRLWVDKLRVKQILLNLLSNAVKFCKPGGKVKVGAELRSDGGFAAWVADTGVGMTEAEIAVALQPFRQVANEFSRNRGGTGLGLPLANGLATLHGGRLDLASEPGKGTTVSIILPADRVRASKPILAARSVETRRWREPVFVEV